jgi:hypothetical protein
MLSSQLRVRCLLLITIILLVLLLNCVTHCQSFSAEQFITRLSLSTAIIQNKLAAQTYEGFHKQRLLDSDLSNIPMKEINYEAQV